MGFAGLPMLPQHRAKLLKMGGGKNKWACLYIQWSLF